MTNAARVLPRRKLTDRGVASAKPGEHWDALVPGLGLRVYESGRKSWIILYRRNRRKIGSYPATDLATARSRAKEMLGIAEAGGDPFTAGHHARTVAEVAKLYVEQRGPALSEDWAREVARTLEADVLPWIGHRGIGDVKRREIRFRLDEIEKRGTHAARNFRAVLSGLYSWAVEREIVDASPVTRLKIAKPRSRDRVLTEGEITEAWSSLLASGNPASRAALLSLVTARRLRECRLLRWEWREDLHWWTIPAPYTKARQTLRVYMPTLAVRLLGPSSSNGHVFPGPPSKNALSCAVRRAIPGATWQARDFRRTAATLMAQSGVERFIVKQVLGHSDDSVTAVYDRYRYDPEKREAVILLALRIRDIIAGRSSASSRPTRARSSRRSRRRQR